MSHDELSKTGAAQIAAHQKAPVHAALIVAAGRGSRARSADDLAPKQYAMIGGLPVLTHTLSAFLRHDLISLVQVVIHADDRALYDEAVAALGAALIEQSGTRLLPPVTGGVTRQASVLAGLQALRSAKPATVLVHDAARPFVSAATISNVVAALKSHDGAIAALPVADTLKRAATDGTIAQTVERAHLWRAQTPQGFQFGLLHGAHLKAQAEGALAFTDDAAVGEWAGLTVALVAGNAANRKLTTIEDLIMANKDGVTSDGADKDKPDENRPDKDRPDKDRPDKDRPDKDRPDKDRIDKIGHQPHWPDIRIGTGFDVHRLIDGTSIWLCGVELPHDKTLEGHSDADVGLHALTDALLGAIGERDIGAHFPPSDPEWKGARSDRFLADAAMRIKRRFGTINNVDVTLICEAPKIGPHRQAMRAAIADILQIEVARVSVKATTSERLGFTGRGEGIAAMASASVTLPRMAAKNTNGDENSHTEI